MERYKFSVRSAGQLHTSGVFHFDISQIFSVLINNSVSDGEHHDCRGLVGHPHREEPGARHEAGQVEACRHRLEYVINTVRSASKIFLNVQKYSMLYYGKVFNVF